jgi:prepilin-type N-terminal cleavage/methylation domain-containing protein
MKRRAAAGFTLLEIMVSLAILGIGVVATMQIFGGSLRLQDRASRETRAVLYARALMDELLIRPEIKNHTEEKETTAEGFKARVEVRSAGASEGIEDKVLDLDIGIGLASDGDHDLLRRLPSGDSCGRAGGGGGGHGAAPARRE